MSVRPGLYDMARGENHRGEKVEGGKVVREPRQYNPWPVFMFMSILVLCITAIVIFA